MSSFDTDKIVDELNQAGMTLGEAHAKANLFKQCRMELPADGRIAAWYVPGRIEFLGKHTDYCGGRSLVCALERGICIVGRAREDSRISITDVAMDSACEFEFGREMLPMAGGWSSYPMTVARRIARNFPGALHGAEIAFASDLPAAAGMSSSSALMIGIFQVLCDHNKLTARDEYQADIQCNEHLAGYLATMENGRSFGKLEGDHGVGTFGGSQDHTAILCSEPDVLCQFSFAPVKKERTVPLPDDHVFVIAVSGVVAEKTAGAMEKYNLLSKRAEQIVSIWNEQTKRSDETVAAALRSGSDALHRLRAMLSGDESLLHRLDQFVEEAMNIIPAASDALRDGKHSLIGPLVDRSQELSETWLGNQVPQTVFLAGAARKLGALAESAFGAGFGGSVWALVPALKAQEFAEEWKRLYSAQFPQAASRSTFFQTTAGPAAMQLHTT